MNKKLLIILVLAGLLRLWGLGSFPSGLNADEAAIGYNAYSLLETGKDEHGNPWPLEFRSFDDYKPPLYFYLDLPFIAAGGLTPTMVRLPSALIGILAVYLTYLLVGHLFPGKKHAPLKPAEFSALLLAISPWHLHFSRGAWEVNVATTLILVGIYAFLVALKRPKLFLLSAICFLLSLYTYHSARIITPLIVVSLAAIYLKDLSKLFTKKQSRSWLLASIVVGLILTVPLILQFTNGSATSRFSGVGLFADQGPLSWVHEQRRLSPDPGDLLTKLRFNRYTAYAWAFVKNYFSHFSPDFLFISGDEIARSKVPGFGQHLHLLLPFFYLGIITVILNLFQNPKGHQPSAISHRLVLAWLLIAPLAASLTFQSPHALRAQNMVIPSNIIITIGILFTLDLADKIIKSAMSPRSVAPVTRGRRPRELVRLLLGFLIGTSLLVNFGLYLNSYYLRYPTELPYAWQYGFEELGQYLQENGGKYDQIIITTRYDQPYILTAFFTQYPPDKLQHELVFSDRDQFGFSTGLSFANYQFHPITSTDFEKENTLLVVADEVINSENEPVHTISYPGSSPSLTLYETSE